MKRSKTHTQLLEALDALVVSAEGYRNVFRHEWQGHEAIVRLDALEQAIRAARRELGAPDPSPSR